jgi:hypothetical protein
MEDSSVRYGYGVTEKALQNLVEEVLRRRAPSDPQLLDAVARKHLTEESREAIRRALADELIEAGLGKEGDPNDHGRLVETAIDWVGHF